MSCVKKNTNTAENNTMVSIHKKGIGPVSYTHLDVYKRQINAN